MVSEENRGWYVGAAGLDIERSGISGATRAKRDFEQILSFVRENRQLWANAAVRHKLAEAAIEIAVARYLAYRVASIQARGQIPNVEASGAKLYHSEMGQRLSRTGIEILGLYGPLDRRSRWSPLTGRVKHQYLRGVAATIGGGTSEMQRNVMAMRGLGLARG